MAIRKKIRPSKNSAPTSRVHKITSIAQWESMLQKAGSRIVVAQFYQSANWTCKQMRPYFTRLSTNGHFRKTLFAEIEVDEAGDVAKAAGVTRIPTYKFFFEGESVKEYTGGVPNQLQQLIKDVQREYCGSSSPLVLAAKAIAALSVLALGSFFAHKHLNKADSPNTSSDAAAELIELKRRIAAARSKLSAFDKAHRSKQARTQRKIVEQLEAKRRLMERGQSGQRGGDVAGRGKGAGKGHRREVEEDEFWPLPPPGPKCRRRQEEVMYSDEEGEVQQQWQRAIAN